MMQRMACFEKIAAVRNGAIVVATYTSAFEWHRVDPDPLNFVSVGAMGQASSACRTRRSSCSTATAAC